MVSPRLQVAARHRVPERQEHLGDARHADATDADEMNVLYASTKHLGRVVTVVGGLGATPLQAPDARSRYASFFFTSSVTSFGLPLPPVALMAMPTSAPSTLALPALKRPTASAFFASTSSTAASMADVSVT